MWLPNAKRVDLGANVRGGPYDDMRKPKVCWHRTQGSTLAGARPAFASYPPHIGYDAATRELEQYVPLDRHSYAFFNGEADDEYIIQIELVGFSEQSQNMPDWQVQNIVDDLVDPLEELIGVPPVVIWHGFRGAGEGIVLARADSPLRISLAELREFSGHLGHQHIPGDGHWDPGRFRIDEVLERSQGGDNDMQIDELINFRPDLGGAPRSLWDGINQVLINQGVHTDLLAAIASNADITPEELQRVHEAAVKKYTPTAQQIATALEATITPLVEAALRRVQDADNLDEAKQTVDELLRRIGSLVPAQAVGQ